MTNMEKIAEMLGVGMGEEFTVFDSSDICRLTPDGIITDKDNRKPFLLEALLSGKKVINKPFLPDEHEVYYCINTSGEVYSTEFWNDSLPDQLNVKVGNCFRTEEEITPEVKAQFRWFIEGEPKSFLGGGYDNE